MGTSWRSGRPTPLVDPFSYQVGKICSYSHEHPRVTESVTGLPEPFKVELSA